MGLDLEIKDIDETSEDLTDLSDKLTESYEVVVECESEEEQEKIFNDLNERGLKCRLLTL